MDEIISMIKMNSQKIFAWVLILAVAIGGGVFGYRFYSEKSSALSQRVSSLESNVAGMQAVRMSVTSGQKEIEELDNIINEKKSAANKNDINAREFFQFMSDKATALNLKLNRINSTGYTENYGVYTVGFDFEVQGQMEDIIKIVSDIDSLGIGYNVKSLTLRDSSDYTWLKREFDSDNQVPWFVEQNKPSDSKGNKIETMSDVENLILQILESQKREEEAKKQEEVIPVIPSGGSSSGSTESKEETETPVVDNRTNTLQGRLEKILDKLPDSIISGKVNSITTENKDDIEIIDIDMNKDSESNSTWVDTVIDSNNDNELSAEDAELLEMILKLVGNNSVDSAQYNEILEQVRQNQDLIIQDEVERDYKLRIIIEFLTFSSPDNVVTVGPDDDDLEYAE